MNSTTFKNSTILTQEQSIQLVKLLNFPSPNFTLIYQASRDGFREFDFHSKVDGIVNTLTVIKTTNGNIFGGFTSADWYSVDNYYLL